MCHCLQLISHQFNKLRIREIMIRADITTPCEAGAELAHKLPSGPENMSALISSVQASDKEEKNSCSFSANCIAMADNSGSVLK